MPPMNKHNSITNFAEARIEEVGAHTLLGEMLQSMSNVEAHTLLLSVANSYPSNVPQSILRDAIARCKMKHEAYPS